MATGGLHSLATIIKRLEAATSRLEDLASLAPASGQANVPPPPPPPPAPSAASAPASASSDIRPVPPPHPHNAVVEVPPSVAAFDGTVVEGKLKPFIELTKSFAIPSVVEQVSLVEKEYTDLRALLLQAALCKEPSQKDFQAIVTPLANDIAAISHAKETNRKDRDWQNHFSFIAEGGTVVGWVTVKPKPGPHIKEIKESAEFHGYRIIKEFKEKNPKHVEWVKAYYALLEQLRLYVMEYHTTGLVWNSKGVDVSQYKPNSASASAAGGPPPPPPPPPPPVAPPPPAGAVPAAGGGVAAVFADLNRGEEVTKGLRKVDRSQMTHKNPALRVGGTVPSAVGGSGSSSPVNKKPTRPAKPQALAGKKPPKFALEGNKWVIEYQENESGLVVDNTDKGQTVNLYGCKGSTVVIKGKVNAVTIVNCANTSVLVDSVISSISVTRSPSFTLQITGKAPTVQLDNTDQGQIYLSKECLATEITTAKCSSINISLPVEGEEDGVFEEHPVPEMFMTTIKDGKLVTVVVEHSG